MGWDVLQVINRGNAAGTACQTGMCSDIFHQFASEPHAAPIPEAFEKLLSSAYRHFLSSQPPFIKNECDLASQRGLPIARNYPIA
jgi:hypothetical protein